MVDMSCDGGGGVMGGGVGADRRERVLRELKHAWVHTGPHANTT